MKEQKTETPPTDNIPEVEVQSRIRQFSFVWIIPLVAALIGVWLVYKAQSEKGPTITITFQTAEGFEAGITKIKYKDVDLGQIEEINLSPDLGHVVVTAKLVRQAEDLLSENTRFWVVRARINVSGVTGLQTLFSGVYIGLDPGRPGKKARHFTGLEQPPIVTTDLPGQYYLLLAERRGSLDIGSPIYYRQIRVGQVVGYQLAEDGQAVSIKIFVNTPYHKYVNKNTRFWNASGVDVSIDAKGIKLNTESLVTLLVGGIAFDVPSYLDSGGPAVEGQVFSLYDSYTASQEKSYPVKSYFVLYFDGSVGGLAPGAPVEFRGISVGKVVDVKLEFEPEKRDFRIPVLIEIEPERFVGAAEMPQVESARRKILDSLVEKGLRGQLKIGNLITGQQVVSLNIFPYAPRRRIVWKSPYPELPTVPAPIEEIGTRVSQILTKIDNLPIEQIGKDLSDTLRSTKQLAGAPELQEAARNLDEILKEMRLFVSELRTGVTPEIAATLVQAQKAIAQVENALGSETPLQVNLNNALQELTAAARSLRALTDYLERHPESLIYGKKIPK
ncbi:MAG: MlaD family protein [Desulfobacterales bacterium]